MRFFFRHVSLLLLLTVTAIAAELKVGSLNCYLLFDPAIDHRGKVDDANRMTPEQYRTKVANLAPLTKGYELVSLQEIGGRDEVTALAKAAGMSWAWTQGKDTATGQDVAVLHNLPGWAVSSKGRVGELDRVVSKHLLVLATKGQERVYFLAVHRFAAHWRTAAEARRSAQGDWRMGPRAIGSRIRRDSRYPRRHQQQRPRVALRPWKRCWRAQWLCSHSSHEQMLRPSRGDG